MNISPKFSVSEKPLEYFFKNPEKTNFQISPNGKKIAFMKPWQDRLNVFIQTIATGEITQVTRVKARNIADYFWANDQTIAFLQDKGGDENFSLYTVNTNGENEKNLTPFEKIKVQIIDILDNDNQSLIIGLNKRDPHAFDAYKLNLTTASLTLIAKNDGNITSWLTDNEGKIRIAIAKNNTNTEILYRKREEDQFQKIMKIDFKDQFLPLKFTPDNQKLYVISNLGSNTSALYLFNPESKIQEKLLFGHNDVDLDEYDLIVSRKKKDLIGYKYVTDKTHYHFFDRKREQLQRELQGKLPNVFLEILNSDREENIFIIKIFSDTTKAIYYLYNSEKKELSLLAKTCPWINPEEMSAMKPISYKARDGLTIHGYLTLPKGKENEKNLPLVVNPHGGPWLRDYWEFNSEVQFLANRGYAVLQMNFRGSLGYGKKFMEAGYKEWGKAMQDDISDGVNWLIKKGVIAPKRIAIYGISYGGYAALAGITFTPELYACAIDYVGLSNLFTVFENLPPYWEQIRKDLEEKIGSPTEDKELLEAVSPIFHIDNIKCPLFVAQGANDIRVKKEHSEQIVAALKSKNIPVEYMIKDNEGHGFSNEENRFDFYRAMEIFLAKYL